MSAARRRGVRYFVRSARGGRELVCPSLSDLHALYAQGFLADDDLVRAENAERWVPAGQLPALGGVREQRRDPRKVALLLAAAVALALAGALVVRGLR